MKDLPCKTEWFKVEKEKLLENVKLLKGIMEFVYWDEIQLHLVKHVEEKKINKSESSGELSEESESESSDQSNTIKKA
mgnify:CR=1 FL=1